MMREIEKNTARECVRETEEAFLSFLRVDWKADNFTTNIINWVEQ